MKIHYNHRCPECGLLWGHSLCIVNQLDVAICPIHAEGELIAHSEKWEYEDDFLQFVTEVRENGKHS